jgi:signal transduction histidine kinase
LAHYRSVHHEEPAAGALPVYQTPTYFSDRLGLSRPVVHQGRSLGHVSIESDLSVFRARRAAYLRMAGLILVVSFGAALLMAYLSQRLLGRPIGDLVAVAKSIAADQDYSRRAPDTGRIREVNTLAQTFNHMLNVIAARNEALVEAHAELDERVRQRTAELDAANRELEAFSYSVSHDLRAPLRHVTGFSELLGAHVGAALDDQGRRYLTTISNASARMARLIDDLLAFSRIGRTTLSRQPVALADLAQEARDEVMAYAPDRVIDWTIGPLPVVEGDPAMLHLVMVNLLSNAVKYTSTRARAVIELGTTEGSPHEVVIFVRDNGVGFDMQYADKLFGVFQRLHRAEQFEGTGIGLAHIKRIVTRHGGRVWATSAVDQGATFFIALPHRKDPHDHEPAKDPAR